MKKRVLSILLCFSMVITLLPMSALAEGTPFTGGMTATMSPGEVGNIWLFANANAIIIEAKGTGTVMKADNNGTPTEIDLAEVTKSLSSPLINNGDNGYDLTNVVILGGKNGESLYSNTSITMNGGTVGAIVGGSIGKLIQGNTNITINGGTIKGANLKYDAIKNNIYAYFVGGSLGDYGYLQYNSSIPVSGEANVTINGGSFDTQFEFYTYGYAGGCSYGNYNSVCSANLYINGGSFNDKTSFYSSSYSKFEGSTYLTNTGKAPAFYIYCNVSGLAGKIRTEDRNLGNNHTSYVITSDEGALTATADKSHLIVIDDANKIYKFGTGVTEACLFKNFTIPAGYKLEIPSGVTLNILKNVTITNQGSLVIKGTLTNNGTISGSGSIVKVGSGAYTGDTPAAEDIPSVVEGFATLTFEQGATRGTTKLTGIDTAEAGKTQYYKYLYSVGGEPTPPTAGATFSSEGYLVIPTADTEITVAKNGGYILTYEVDSESKIVKYTCTEMTDETIGGEAYYDALETSILCGGDGDNTTKITATADSENTLYYSITDSTVGTNYAYNTPIDVSGLTEVNSGTDITTSLGKYLSVYEVSSGTKLLRKFFSVPITLLYFTGYTGGLVADTANKIIYCDGKTVCVSAEYYSGHNISNIISAPRLYVLENGAWIQAVPKNLPFSEGYGFNDYTLSGIAGAEDTSEAKGSLYILSSNYQFNDNRFYNALPKGAADFANFIIPNLSAKGTDGWQLNYTVGGSINPLDSKQDHLNIASEFRYFEMSSLNLQNGANFTVPSVPDGSAVSGDIHIYFTGNAATDIIKGTGASVQYVHNLVYKPQVDLKLIRADGTEFSKDGDGKYLVPKDTRVTIVATYSVYNTQAPLSTLPGVCSSEPEKISSVYTSSPDLLNYTVGFRKRIENDYNYSCYGVGKLDISFSGSNDEKRVTTLALTLADINAYEGYEFFVSNKNIQSELGGAGYVPPQLLDSFHTFSYSVTKSEQAAITAAMPEAANFGTTDINVGASGGSGTGAFSYSSSDTDVATVDENGSITIFRAGSTEISVTKAGDGDYESRTDTFTLIINKKVPTISELALTPAANLVYSGSAKPAAVVAKAGVNGLGSVAAIYYEGKNGTAYAKSTEAPTNAGTYQVSADLAEGSNYTAASGIDAGEFIITKSTSYPAPANGTIDDSANTFTFTPVAGYSEYEFSVDSCTTWTDCVDTDSNSSAITISIGNIAGTVWVRIKETGNYTGNVLASLPFSASLEGSVAITGTAKYGQTITANVTGAQSNAVLSYVWKAAGEQIANTNVNTLTLEMVGLIGKTITVEVSAAPYTGTLSSAQTASVVKAVPTGNPSNIAITTGGKTLSDAVLAIGTLKPDTAGYTLKWVDDKGEELSGTTEVKSNAAYNWLFTPKDTASYETLSGAITLYSVSTGGNGGSSGGASASNTVTVQVSGGFGSATISAYVSDGIATVSASEAQLREITSGSENSGTVKIDMSSLKVNTVVIPTELVYTANAAARSSGLEVALTAGNVTLDKSALEAVSGKGDIKLSVETVDNTKLTDAQKAVLGNQAGTAIVVDVNIFVNDTKTSTFGDGKITVTVPYTLKPGERGDRITVWFVKDDGTIEPKQGVYSDGKVIFTTEHLSQYLVVSFPFIDVAEDDWYYNSVAYAYNNNLFSGTSISTFEPNAAMTREMIWMVLARMDGETPANMEEARAWAVENGLSDGSERANSITREQMATILYRYAQYKKYDTTQGGMAIREFADYESISEYALPALAWTVRTGLVKGSDNHIMPCGTATRSEVATILQRFCQNVAK